MTRTTATMERASVKNRKSDESREKHARNRRLIPPPNGVTVRMYRQGLGDCFLLAFSAKSKDRPFYMLIDCGVIVGTENPEKIMTQVAKDIAAATDGRIDVVVTTHEHWDHLSGFIQAKDVFEKEIKFGQAWMAWTENPNHPLAKELRKQKENRLNLVDKAIARLTEPKSRRAFDTGKRAEDASRLDEVLGFHGMSLLGAAGASRQQGTGDALKNVRSLVPSEPKYWRPGQEPITLDELPNVRFYILGPPEDRAKIRRSDPRKGEAYLSLSDEGAFQAALGISGDGSELSERGHPFEKSVRLTPERLEFLRAKADHPERFAYDFFEKHYGLNEEESSSDKDWRRIDGEWMGFAERLALQMDSDTNNTSLVMALELTRSGKVLLFPGDAQAGNWDSWDDYSWPKIDARGSGTSERIKAVDLLSRTVLYKVGHHGSHNATLQEKGLERMTSPDLVAMIPVNKAMAKKKRWNMPFPRLYQRLVECARGRVLSADTPEETLESEPPGAASKAEWKEFLSRARLDDANHLYVEYDIVDKP